ncbi:alpha/beta hydrolase [Marinobacterium arenosum]|uniref:alpha/beta hydrolase n=1 Tax=Marinobacterium arenosum TaxID=2862496 RepID=UPI001C97F420|nr:alpha/beta hydrolase [Marinobacterium arenosum]MBY4678050.1 alpha/beta hydrolase [Marinobacterium arenosum]
MSFNPQSLAGLIPEFDCAPCHPAAALQPYCRHYRLDRLQPLGEHRLGLLDCHGSRLCVQLFSPLQPAIGCALVVHGYMEHTGLYQPLIAALLGHRFRVLCYDLPGHGLSEGPRYWIDDFSRYGCQLGELIQRLQERLSGPGYLIGFSTGAAVVIMQQLLLGDTGRWPLARRILLAPLIRPAQWRSIRTKYHCLKYLLRTVARFYSVNSHDARYLHFVREQDPLQHNRIPVDWIAAMLAWERRVELAGPLPGEVLVVQGLEDGTVDWPHNLAVLSRLYPACRVALIEGARHQLINESPPYQQRLFKILQGAMRPEHNALALH